MQTPPPYMPPAPVKKNNTLLWVLVIAAIGVCCIGPIALFGGGLFLAGREGMPMVNCLIAHQQVADALKLYAEANKGKLPNAKTWQDDLAPYIAKASADMPKENTGPFKFTPLKADEPWGCEAGGTTTGIAFNSDLSGKQIADYKEKMATVVLFEIRERERNQSRSFKPQPHSDSPKILGTPRGWIQTSLDGNVEIVDEKGKAANVKVSTGGVKVQAGTGSDPSREKDVDIKVNPTDGVDIKVKGSSNP